MGPKIRSECAHNYTSYCCLKDKEVQRVVDHAQGNAVGTYACRRPEAEKRIATTQQKPTASKRRPQGENIKEPRANEIK